MLKRLLPFLAVALLFLASPAWPQDAGNQGDRQTPEGPGDIDVLDSLDIPGLGIQGLDVPDIDLNQEQFAADEHLPCLCGKVLAAVLCKDPTDFNYRAQRKGVYFFSSFYASNYEDFYVRVAKEQKMMVITSTAWAKKVVSVSYEVDDKAKCLRATVAKSMCGSHNIVECCLQSRQDQ
jgi:hypothetical protein